MMSFLNYTLGFAVLARHMSVQIYGRDGGPDKPRFRLELKTENKFVSEYALTFEMQCVACGSPIYAFRRRKGKNGSIYFAVTCPLDVNISCSRKQQAADEYTLVREALDIVLQFEQGVALH